MENRRNEIIQLERAIGFLKGEACWSVIAGEGSGSIVSISFGEKIARKKTLNNPFLSDEQKQYEGEYELYIECAWRLESKDEILCSSTSSNHRGGQREAALARLLGSVVDDVSVTFPGGDLQINFDNCLKLLVFSDQANEVDEVCNFVFFAEALAIENGTGSKISVRSRS